ncbi:MAG: efflux RND transporter periplasmic adaptor subunit [Acidiferrobacterales bacterium]
MHLTFDVIAARAARIAGLTALAGAFTPYVAAQAPPTVPVVVAKAEQRVLAPVTYFPGAIISRDDARIAAEVEGRLMWVADVGTTVNKDDIVVRLDDELIRQDLVEQEATVRREKARLKFYTQEVKRLEPLLKRKVITPSNLDQAISNRDVAKGELAVARARVRQTRERLKRTKIHAPFGGVVTERFAQAGEWASEGEAIVRLVDARAIEIQTRVPVSTLAFIKKGTTLTLNASPREGTARVRTIVPVGGDRSRLYELRLTPIDTRWTAGQTVKVAVPTAAPRKVIAVPRDALVIRRDGTSVYRILDDNTAERVSVKPGVAAGAFIEVRNGVRPGDRVVIRGGERLRPKQKVVVIPSTKK